MIQNALPQCDWWTTIHKHVSSFFCNFFLLKVPALLQGIYSEGSKVGCNLPESSCLQPVRPFDCSKENQGNRLSTYWRLCFLLDSSCVRTNALRLRFAKRELNTTINQSASKKSPSVPCHSMSFHVIPCHSMSFHVIPCHSMSFHVIPCHSMSFHVWCPMTSHAKSCPALKRPHRINVREWLLTGPGQVIIVANAMNSIPCYT